MRKLIIILLLVSLVSCGDFWDFTLNHTLSCSKQTSLTDEQQWEMIILHKFDRYWFITVGPVVLILLILLFLSFCIPGTRTPPADIILVTCIFELFLVGSVVIQAAYTFANDPDSTSALPKGFPAFCDATGFLYILGIAGINIYNIIFCLMLAFTVKNALKNKLFSMACYHTVGTLLSVLLPVTVFALDQTGKELSGICGFKYSLFSPYIFLISSIIFIGLATVSAVIFKNSIPNSSFFRKLSVYKFYYIYIMLVACVQLIMSIGYTIGAANCNRQNPDPLLNITMTAANCLILIHPVLLCFIRYKHPTVQKYIKKMFKKKEKKGELNPFDEDQDMEYNWLGSLMESIRASQLLSFLAGILVSYVEYWPKPIPNLKSIDFKTHYTFKIDEETADNYLERMKNKRESYRVYKELGGLKPLHYEVTCYCPRVFFHFLQSDPQIRLDHSLNIQSNSAVIKTVADVSGGKSGQFFFFSHDNSVIFKTVSKSEADSYIKKIRNFTNHYEANPNSLIVKIIGLYKFKRIDGTAEEIYLTLQKNLSTCDKIYIQRVFDLKGSEYNRETLAEKKVEDLSTTTLKDLDFLKLQKKIFISGFISQGIKKILKKDIEFLKLIDVMDYSLLVMKINWKLIAFGKQKTLEQILPRNGNYLERVPCETQDGIYYHFGIIDYLQEWGMAKQTEKLIKQLVTREFNKSIITAEEPKTYANRLIEFIDSIFP